MKSPAFQFYPAEFLSDENVILMSNQEIGCYIKLMCLCWREGSIPSDVNKIAKLCGESGSVMAELWTAIGECFKSATDNTSRLVHPRLEKERLKQIEHKKERSASGKKGAEAKWNKAKEGVNEENKEPMAKPMAEPMANDGSSSSSSSSSIKPKSKELSVPAEQTVSKKGTRLSPDWQLPKAWGDWALSEKPDLNPVDVRRIADDFRDYWIAKAGKDAVKMDWLATWRKWVRSPLNEIKQSSTVQDARLKVAQQILGNSNGNDRSFIDVTPAGPLESGGKSLPKALAFVREPASSEVAGY